MQIFLTTMNSYLNHYGTLCYRRFEIKLRATDDMIFDAWPGAIIRNNLLFAAEQVQIQKNGRTLREQIDDLPLAENHPLYKELKEGFPKGYVLTDFSHFDSSTPCGTILKGEDFTFALLLIGQFNDYRFYFFEAIREMCERGIGKPITPFQLIDISEDRLSPVSLNDFMQRDTVDCFSTLTARFLTPTILIRPKGKKNTQLSYQDKTNRFPSLYQLTRSLLSRMIKLYALYVDPANLSASHYEEEILDAYLEKAGLPLLRAAAIQYKNLPNARKKEKKNEMPLAGYVGEQTYEGYFDPYLPLLKFMSALGVGNDTVYGLGQFEVIVHPSSNCIQENQKIEVENEVMMLAESDHPAFPPAGDNGKGSLTVRFKNRIKQDDIPLLIEAIAQNATNDNELFLPYMLCGTPYRYPFIQIKRIRGQLAIICIGEGTEHIGGFFSSADLPVLVNGKKLVLEVEDVKAANMHIQARDTNLMYSIQNYLPMSNDKYIEYQSINDQSECIAFMEEILGANLLFFANSMGVQFDREIVCALMELEERATLKYKSQPFVSFDLIFRTNITLPDYIGLGLGVSHGFGTIKRMTSQKNQ